MKCGNCGQDILQAHPDMCPYCKSKNLISEEDASKEIEAIEHLAKIGRYEDAARKYEKLELWDKVRECRRLAKKNRSGSIVLETAKIGAISVVCPHCGESQPASSKTKELTCARCGTSFLIPEKVFELL